jgi:hypothetical protein
VGEWKSGEMKSGEMKSGRIEFASIQEYGSVDVFLIVAIVPIVAIVAYTNVGVSLPEG